MPNVAASDACGWLLTPRFNEDERKDMGTSTREWFDEKLLDIKYKISNLTSRQTMENDYEYSKILRLNLHGMANCLEFITNNPPKNDETVDEYRKRITSLINEFRVAGREAQAKEPSVEIVDYSNESLAGFWDSGVRSASQHLGLVLFPVSGI